MLYPTTLITTIVVALTTDPESRGTIPLDLNIIAALMSVRDFSVPVPSLALELTMF